MVVRLLGRVKSGFLRAALRVRYAAPRYAASRSVASRFATSRYATSRYATSRYAASWSVASSLRARPVRTAWTVLTVLGVVFAATGCDGAASGAFPSFLPWVSAERKITALPVDARHIEMEAVALADGSRFFSIMATPDGPGPRVLVLLDATLAVVVRREETDTLRFDTRLFATIDGRVQRGNLVYDPATNEVSISTQTLDGAHRVLHDGSEYVVMDISSPTEIQAERFTAAFQLIGGSGPVAAFSDGAALFDITTNLRFNASSGDPEAVVFLFQDGGFRRVRFPASAFSGPLPFPVDVTTTPGSILFRPVDPWSLQETPEGILAADGETLFRLDPTTGAVLDRFEVGTNPRARDRYPVVFDPAGRFYLLYDQANHVVFKVEAWW